MPAKITKNTTFWVRRESARSYGNDIPCAIVRLIHVARVTPENALRMTSRKNCTDADRTIGNLVARGIAVYDRGYGLDTLEIRWTHYEGDQWCDPHFADLGRYLAQIRDTATWLQRAEDANALRSPDSFVAWLGKQGLDLVAIPGTGYYVTREIFADLYPDAAADAAA